jgi:hypothetical protein
MHRNGNARIRTGEREDAGIRLDQFQAVEAETLPSGFCMRMYRLELVLGGLSTEGVSPATSMGTWALIWFGLTYSSGACLPSTYTCTPPRLVGSGSSVPAA